MIDAGSVQALVRGADGLVWRELTRRGNNVLNAARRNAPVDQGGLRGSLHMEHATIDGQPAVRIGSNLQYALYVHEGTGIYGPKGTPIRPNGHPFLRWPFKNNSGSGRRRYKAGATAAFVYAREVKGVRPRPFLRDALEAASQ